MRVGRSAIFVALIAILCAASIVLAGGGILFRAANGQLHEAKWDSRQMPLRFLLSSDGYPGSGITNNQLLLELEAALAAWQNVTTSSVSFQPITITSASQSGGESPFAVGMDGRNLITFTDNSIALGPGVLGACHLTRLEEPVVISDRNSDLDGDGTPDLPNGTYPAGTVLDADVVFDPSDTFSLDGAINTVDLRQVAIHEIGHCLGLSHSSIPGSVMWPEYNLDVTSGRTLKQDDIAHVSRLYQQSPTFAASYGKINGLVLSGSSSLPVKGAHVFAAHVSTKERLVGAYTTHTGEFELVVPAGSYLIGIEPLDGEPDALVPERINEVIADTIDVSFPEEYFDASESNRDNGTAAQQITVVAGQTLNGINITTNLESTIRSLLTIEQGINYLSYPVALGSGLSAYQVLSQLAAQGGVTSIERYDPELGQFQRAQMLDGSPRGYNFSLKRGEGYIVHSTRRTDLSFAGAADCPTFNLAFGLNLIGAPCAPPGYSAFDLLRDLGEPASVVSVQRFRPESRDFELATFAADDPQGVDFPIVDGGAYIVELRTPRLGFRINRAGSAFAPSLTAVSPGEGVRGALIALLGSGFDPVSTRNAVLFNGVGADVIESSTQQLLVRVPQQAVTGSVKVLVGGVESNSLPFFVAESHVNAEEGPTFEAINGQEINASIEDAEDIDYFRFFAVQGNRVSITANAKQGPSPQLEVTLAKPDGGVMAAAESRTTGVAVLRDVELPMAGHYVVGVRALPNGGTGAYRLRIDVTGTGADPAIQIVSGNYQTGVAGTELPQEVEIAAVASTGLATSQVPISITVSPVVNPMALAVTSSPDHRFMELSSTTLVTGRSGNLVVRVQLPATTGGEYNVMVSAPGMKSATLVISAVDRPVHRVEITPSEDETCGGGGCVVGELITQPYKLRYLDDNGDPIAGVLAMWAVAAGEGSLQSGAGAIPCRSDIPPAHRCTRSGVDGTVSVFHQLGQKLFFPPRKGAGDSGFDPNAPLLSIPQQVVATAPGQAAPIVFTARARAGSTERLVSLRSGRTLLSLGIAELGSVRVLALDEYENPVAGQAVQFQGLPSGIVQVPGYIDGEIYESTVTNAKGLWSRGLGAIAGVARPTLDERGNSGVLGLALPYKIHYAIPDSPHTGSVEVDVDMGPWVAKLGDALAAHALIGQTAPKIDWLAQRYQRVDADGDGDWTDESEFRNVRAIQLPNVAMSFTYRRADRRYIADSGFAPVLIGGQLVQTKQTNPQGMLTVDDITMGSVFGRGRLVSMISPITVQFRRTVPQQPYVDADVFESKTFIYSEARGFPVNADPVVLTLNVVDPYSGPPIPNPDPYPTTATVSGISPASVEVLLNNSDVFAPFRNGQTSLLNDFPNYARIRADGQDYGERVDCFGEAACLTRLRPQRLEFTYHPTLEQLRSQTENELRVRVKDGVENGPGEIECNFSLGEGC